MRRFLDLALLTAVAAATLPAPSATQALANHVHCGDVVTQDTKLDSDLTDCQGDGLVIGADDITLDLNGHTIDGDAVQSEPPRADTGITNDGHPGVTMENGTLRDFDVGITLYGASANHLRHLAVCANSIGGIHLSESDHNVVEDSSACDNGYYATGIVLGESNSNALLDNSVFGNGHDGIRVFYSSDNQIKGNSLHANVIWGIDTDEASYNQIENNTIVGGVGGMCVCINSNQNGIERNSVSRTAHEGIWLDGANFSSVARNVVVRNGTGISLCCLSRGNRLDSNKVLRNTEEGILLRNEVWDCCGFGEYNQITRNFSARNGADGILVVENTLTEIEDNVSTRNGDDGIDVGRSLNTLARNQANRNDDLGVEAASGVTDGGGNTAFGNGNPLQCLNVVCETERQPPK